MFNLHKTCNIFGIAGHLVLRNEVQIHSRMRVVKCFKILIGLSLFYACELVLKR